MADVKNRKNSRDESVFLELSTKLPSSVSREYLSALMTVAICTLVSSLMFHHVQKLNLIMVYLLGVVVVALRGSRGPAILTAVLSVLSFDYFFVEPLMQLVRSDGEYLFTLTVMLIVSILICQLSIRAREQAKINERAQVQVEMQKIRNTLLSSLSHDLRTPLSAIAGAASSLFTADVTPAVRKELAHSIYDQADRLNRLLRNMLDATRLNTGGVRLKKEWQSVEEVIGVVLTSLDHKLKGHPVNIKIISDLPLVQFDGTMIEQVLTNIIENAIKHSPPDGKIDIAARVCNNDLLIEITNEGDLLRTGDESKIFDRFYRGSQQSAITGVGLGLAICRAIVTMHGGIIWAENVDNEGVKFSFTLPIEGEVPKMEIEEQ